MISTLYLILRHARLRPLGQIRRFIFAVSKFYQDYPLKVHDLQAQRHHKMLKMYTHSGQSNFPVAGPVGIDGTPASSYAPRTGDG